MPLTIPAFDQYQQPMFPLRGLWNHKPPEGDKYVNVEIDWTTTTKGSAVQFALSGNSPVSLSQIVALVVDNGRCGEDVDFIFPDSGFILTVAAHCQGVFPVFTNALMFYASAPNTAAGDVTILQILNSMPPVIPIAPTEQQNRAGVSGVAIANGTTVLVPAPTNGTVNALSITIAATAGAGGGNGQITLNDGKGNVLWGANPSVPASTTQTFTYNLTGLNVRFLNGLNVVVAGSTFSGGVIVANAYYTTP
jgi:hypothetical protein